ncbi:hypothetical protein [Aliikangiella coralliicola]|uniref:DUF3379 domain-containing protein n=1 Tax=Aliikangiella coralliicola TaxID=2592383 RepID=A0A545UCX0_9GAMM|nr:hypothetical protein [Aliikangiella coralliicola]TQV87316.1 hypothetical protein FLL46_12770 [Aliikangiella coralliicola]
MTKNVKQSVKDFYCEFELNDAQIKQLQNLTNIESSNNSEKAEITDVPQNTGKLTWLKSCAAVLLVGVLTLSFYFPQYQQEKMVSAIVSEVAKNHLKMKPLDISSNQYAQLRKSLDKLDFSITNSSYFTSEQDSLLGARYCSIQTVTAAQLRFIKSTDQLITLYQVPYDHQKHADIPDVENGEQPLVRFKLGLRVELWQEKGLLMVSTQAIENGSEKAQITPSKD